MNRRIKMKRMKQELEVLRNKPVHVQIVKDSRKVSRLRIEKSEGDWNSICETMHLKSIPGMEESLLKGKESSLSDCITEEKIEEISETDEYVAVMR